MDVVSSASLEHGGVPELAQQLAVALPSLNFTRPAVTDGSDTIRPATLRGLSPDQTLMLVNSKRRHASSLVNLNGAIGYGAASVDLNAIPTAAVGSIEVLRDGASAEYGSDAIAGVVNIRLREADHGGNIQVTYGQRSTLTHWNPNALTLPGLEVPTRNYFNDGQATTVSGWTGVSLGGKGFLTLSAESVVQEHTTRSGPDPRPQYPAVNGTPDPREFTFNRIDNWYGDPRVHQYSGYANAGYDLNDAVRLYGWAGYQDRDAISAANVRRADRRRGGEPVRRLSDGAALCAERPDHLIQWRGGLPRILAVRLAGPVPLRPRQLQLVAAAAPLRTRERSGQPGRFRLSAVRFRTLVPRGARCGRDNRLNRRRF